MLITIDGQAVQLDDTSAMPLAEAIKRLSEQHGTDRRTVIKVVVDGENVTGRFDHAVYSRSVQEFRTVELETGDPHTLALDALPMLRDFLARLKNEVNNANEGFRFGRTQEAHTSLSRISDGIMLVAHAVERTRSLLRLDFGTMVYNEQSVLDHYTRLSELIEEIISAQGESDWILVADLLEFELLPVLSDWEAITTLIEEKGTADVQK